MHDLLFPVSGHTLLSALYLPLRHRLKLIPALVAYGPVATWKSRLADLTLCWFGWGEDYFRLCSVHGISEHALGLSSKRFALPTIIHDPKSVEMIRNLIECTAEGRSVVTKGTTRLGQAPACAVLMTMNGDKFSALASSHHGDQTYSSIFYDYMTLMFSVLAVLDL